MPVESIVILAAILGAFGFFAVMLALGDLTSGDLRRDKR